MYIIWCHVSPRRREIPSSRHRVWSLHKRYLYPNSPNRCTTSRRGPLRHTSTPGVLRHRFLNLPHWSKPRFSIKLWNRESSDFELGANKSVYQTKAKSKNVHSPHHISPKFRSGVTWADLIRFWPDRRQKISLRTLPSDTLKHIGTQKRNLPIPPLPLGGQIAPLIDSNFWTLLTSENTSKVL